MGLLDLSPYKVTNNVSAVDATTQDSAYDAIQAVVNALVNANIDPAAAIALSKLADPTTGKVVGSSGGSAAAVYPPGYEYAYNEFTGNVSVTATTEGAANTIVTASAVTFDGSTTVMIEFFSPLADTGLSTAAITLVLFEDGVAVGQIAVEYGSGGAELQAPIRVARRRTPASGSRTYSVRAFMNVGTGSVHAGAGGAGVAVPGYIRITKV